MTPQISYWKLTVAIVFLGYSLLGSTNSLAQTIHKAAPESPREIATLFDAPMPVSSSSMTVTTPPASGIVVVKPVARKQHTNFFDRKNNFLIGASATAIAFDGLSTQRFLADPNCHELNPLARPFVGSRAGAVGYFGLSFAGEVALMRLAHKLNHHRIERIIPMLVIGSESSMVYNNYSLSHR